MGIKTDGAINLTMTSIAFWNLGGRVQPLSIRSLVCEHDIDILVLAENPESVEELRGKLNHRLEQGNRTLDAGKMFDKSFDHRVIP